MRCMFGVIEPTDAGFSLIVLALTMVIIGGFGSWFGALLGAFLLTWLPLRLSSFGSWWPVIYGGPDDADRHVDAGRDRRRCFEPVPPRSRRRRLRSPLPTRRDETEPAREAA